MFRRTPLTLMLLAAAATAVPAVCLAAAAGHGADAGEHAPAGIRDNLPFWGLVAFLGFLYAIRKLGWNALVTGMREREENELRLIGEAEQLRQQALEQLRHSQGLMEAVDEHVREALAEAGRDADHTRNDIRAVAQREAQLVRQRAEAEIERVRSQSLSDIFEATVDRIVREAEARIRTRLSPVVQQKLIDTAVAEFTQKA
jgi:F0F1-type ATP synthase membrane subunit b/b'